MAVEVSFASKKLGASPRLGAFFSMLREYSVTTEPRNVTVWRLHPIFFNGYFKKIWLFFDLHCFSAQVLNLCWWLFHTEGAQLWICSSCVFLHSSTQHATHDQSRGFKTVSIDIQVAARFSFLNGVLQIFNARLWARNIPTSCFSHPHPPILSSGLEMAPNSIFSCVSGGCDRLVKDEVLD